MMIDYELKKYGESQYRIKDIQMQIKEIERQIEDYNAISNMIERKQCENLGIQKQRMINKVIENEVIIRDKFIRKLRKKIVKLKDKENKIEESIYKITNIIENLEESDKFLIEHKYILKESIKDIAKKYNLRYISTTRNFNENSCRFYFHKLKLKIQDKYL